MTQVTGTKQMTLSYDMWGEGWDYWQDPEKLFADKPVMNINYLQQLLEKAVTEENYEEAEKIKNQIENLNNESK